MTSVMPELKLTVVQSSGKAALEKQCICSLYQLACPSELKCSQCSHVQTTLMLLILAQALKYTHICT